ncbi:MAG TPA: hypothetical protein VMT89_07495, partial [Candidatus Acidoferrales bacterium]|nr:hypothetical protein [Candidatus Acidoferrales bacterium]
FYDAPLPSADLQTGDGHVDLSRFPNPNHLAIVNQAITLLSRDANGFAMTGGVFFSLTGRIDQSRLPNVNGSLSPAAHVLLISVDDRKPIPVHAEFVEDGGPFGAPNLLSLVPFQGVPLKPHSRYVAVVCAELQDTNERLLQIAPAVESLASNTPPAALSAAQGQDYLDGYRAARDASKGCTIAGLAVFTTEAPADTMDKFITAALQDPLPAPRTFTRNEVFDDYCVYSTTIDMPDYQQGTAPYMRTGGDWRVDEQGQPLPPHFETSSMFVTVPRAAMPAAGFPLVEFVRAGGGGDRPLVDRGVQGVPGGPPLVAGSGPAQEFARVGYAGAQVDGPLGGLRNTTHGDEQFLIFNVFNVAALRDNIRESALELVVFSNVLDHVEIDSSDCPGAPAISKFDPSQRALMGHSTGATIAPLPLAFDPHLRAAVFSGEGGSYIENVLYKRKPIPVLPVANMLLGYTNRSLTENDPVLSLVQWVAEPADPPVYADLIVRNPQYRNAPAHVLMLQGIVDNYILPDIANTSSLSLGLDVAGPALDDPSKPGLADQTPILSVLPLSGRKQIQYPASCNVAIGSGCITAVLTQHPGDGIEDGHEVVFQTEPPKHQYRCFLKTLLNGTPEVPADTDASCG